MMWNRHEIKCFNLFAQSWACPILIVFKRLFARLKTSHCPFATIRIQVRLKPTFASTRTQNLAVDFEFYSQWFTMGLTFFYGGFIRMTNSLVLNTISCAWKCIELLHIFINNNRVKASTLNMRGQMECTSYFMFSDQIFYSISNPKMGKFEARK